MNKKYIRLIIGVLFIAVLAGVYFFALPDDDGTEDLSEESEENEDFIKITDGEKENLASIILQHNNVLTELIPYNGDWAIKGYENIALNKSNVESFIESMLSISAETVLNDDDNTERFGLANPEKSICLKFNDGSETLVYIGDSTPDNYYCYAKKPDDDTIYTINHINGQRAEYTINDFADKTIPQVSPYKIAALNIKRKNAPEIDLEYTTEKAGNAQNLIEMGMETMNMKKPYDGMAVYPTNLQETVLVNLTDIQLGDIAQASLDNIEKFGIDSPEVEVSVSDGTNYLHITVGNKADGDNYYCIADDKNAVFLIDSKYVNPFLNADPIKFVEKFVALYYRADVESAEIKEGDTLLEVTFGEEAEEETNGESESGNNRFNDDRKSYINGKELDKSSFSDFFELLVGITFDEVDETAQAVSDNPEVVIKYTLKDGSADEIKFLPFNESFYIVEDRPIKGMLVSRQKVRRVFEKADELLK